ncbi:MAG: DMT family transporter [Chloroflexi bacterium]|nr:DMT family transporter [Chloroflexota bacterium]
MMNTRNFVLLILLAAMWGPSFLFIKVAVETIPPVTLVFFRVLLAAVLLYLFLRWQHGRLPRSLNTWKHLSIVALVHNAIPFVLFAWGEQYVDSALASILNGSIPLFTILLAHVFTQDDHLTPAKIGGVLIGFAGMVALVLPTLQDGVEATTWGVLALTLAAFLYGIAIVYTRLHLRGLPPLVAPTGQLIMATVFLFPVMMLLEKPYLGLAPSVQSVASLVALSVLGTAVAFILYYRLIEQAGASMVSMVAYVIPVFGIILGVVILNESLTVNMVIGGGLILVGVMVVNGLFNSLRLPKSLHSKRSHI